MLPFDSLRSWFDKLKHSTTLRFCHLIHCGPGLISKSIEQRFDFATSLQFSYVQETGNHVYANVRMGIQGYFSYFVIVFTWTILVFARIPQWLECLTWKRATQVWFLLATIHFSFRFHDFTLCYGYSVLFGKHCAGLILQVGLESSA